MMNVFSALLEARDPALGRFRSYRLEAGTDLFGTWLVEVEYGKIGAAGHRVRYVAGPATATPGLGQARSGVHPGGKFVAPDPSPEYDGLEDSKS
jgi:hypothetical protein